ncbi:MAG: hypothetical protein IH851_00440 [Armatimonadetes bacterium]|nr:hypothetical protein [Armatimonadota bacterium]
MPRLFPHQVRVQTDRPRFPDRCVCCGEDADTTYRPTPPQRRRGMPEPDDPLLLPYCFDCFEHLHASQTVGTMQLLALNVAVWGVAAMMIANLGGTVLAIGPAAGLALYIYARKIAAERIRKKPSCAGADIVMRSVWDRRETYIFSFASESYAEEFRKANEGVLSGGA